MLNNELLQIDVLDEPSQAGGVTICSDYFNDDLSTGIKIVSIMIITQVGHPGSSSAPLQGAQLTFEPWRG